VNSPTQRFETIDALRGVAALWVFFYHLWNPIFPNLHTQQGPAHWSGQESWTFYITFFLFQYGYFGVTIFFVISGFCIHWPQARRHAQTGSDGLSLGRFFQRRFWRLYPAYFAGLFVASLGLGLMRIMEYRQASGGLPPTDVLGEAFGLDLIPTNALFLSPFYAQAKDLNSVLWTLVFEVQFYLLYPLLLVVMRSAQRALPGAGLLAVGGVLLICEACLVPQPKTNPTVSEHDPWFYFFLGRYFEWYLGVLAAEFLANRGTPPQSPPHTGGKGWGSRAWAGLVLTVGLAVAATFSMAWWPYRDILVALATFFVITLLLRPRMQPKQPAPWLRGLAWVGLFSYSLYLLHIPLLRIMGVVNRLALEWLGISASDETMSLILLDSIPVVILFSFGFYWIFERPFMKK
jgi:peptidoglycan/LPS O-acetylase OafA/YrhL